MLRSQLFLSNLESPYVSFVSFGEASGTAVDSAQLFEDGCRFYAGCAERAPGCLQRTFLFRGLVGRNRLVSSDWFHLVSQIGIRRAPSAGVARSIHPPLGIIETRRFPPG